MNNDGEYIYENDILNDENISQEEIDFDYYYSEAVELAEQEGINLVGDLMDHGQKRAFNDEKCPEKDCKYCRLESGNFSDFIPDFKKEVQK